MLVWDFSTARASSLGMFISSTLVFDSCEMISVVMVSVSVAILVLLRSNRKNVAMWFWNTGSPAERTLSPFSFWLVRDKGIYQSLVRAGNLLTKLPWGLYSVGWVSTEESAVQCRHDTSENPSFIY